MNILLVLKLILITNTLPNHVPSEPHYTYENLPFLILLRKLCFQQEEELELRQLQGWINPMLDQLWQWATPALNDLEQGAKYYKRCFTGTPEIQNLSLKVRPGKRT